MPFRMVLNVVYAMLVDGLDQKQRDDLDAELYGFNEMNARANRRLMGNGGEDE